MYCLRISLYVLMSTENLEGMANCTIAMSSGQLEPSENGETELWLTIRKEASDCVSHESLLTKHLNALVLAHTSLEHALSFILASKLASIALDADVLYKLFVDVMQSSAKVREGIYADLRAVKERDPACTCYCHCVLNFKGFQACQVYRIAHCLWNQDKKAVAYVLQSRMSEVFGVDIHPAARIGKGVLFDHAAGVVIGETAVVGDNVAILHGVTLGGTGKHGGDRHPKIGAGVLIGAGASIIGNITVGDGAKIGAGALVLMEVPPRTTAVGCPARLVGGRNNPTKLTEPPIETMDHLSYVADWCDYVI
ncbi:hypothetical protein KP509_12G001100 [Ceratopteris richardii]|uniref:serine O-acetyltransferase n=3 Tax=Ceratopteris richardii TaxID=49495 RepID=A0A8T2TK97_CERRI|nr:hypothetical protein KP509_12G000800 [Ceratopteris richardii]KAH7422269.1 hypothetical protein KP509_12G001100 [Ceratopteris richardii]